MIFLTSVLYCFAMFCLFFFVVGIAEKTTVQNAISFLFCPICFLVLWFLLPLVWNLTLGPLQGPSDDGRGFGSAIVFATTFFCSLLLTPVLFFKANNTKNADNEVPS